MTASEIRKCLGEARDWNERNFVNTNLLHVMGKLIRAAETMLPAYECAQKIRALADRQIPPDPDFERVINENFWKLSGECDRLVANPYPELHDEGCEP